MNSEKNGYVKISVNIEKEHADFLRKKAEKADKMGLKFEKSKYIRNLLDKEMNKGHDHRNELLEKTMEKA